MFDKLHAFFITHSGMKLYGVVVSAIILSGIIGMIAGYQFAKSADTKTETYTKTTPYPTISSTTQQYPTQIPTATQATIKQTSFQKCLEDAARTLQEKYNKFCEKWMKENNSYDCPGFDEIGIPGEECYKKFGIPTSTQAPSRYTACPSGWVSVCEAGACDCQKI